MTEYAKSKVDIENYLKKKTDKDFSAISLRFSTACGASRMLRLDLVLNDFVASAISTKEIKLNIWLKIMVLKKVGERDRDFLI